MRLSNLIDIYRIKDWIHYIGFFVLGYSLYQSSVNLPFVLQVLEASFILSYAYSVNQFFDTKMPKKRIYLPLIPLLLSLAFLFFFDAAKDLLIIGFIALSTLYSVPKIRLKSFPVVGSMSNNFGFLFLFLLGASDNLTNILTVKYSFLVFFLQSAAQFIHEISHMKEDKRDRLTTTAIFFGKERTMLMCVVLLGMASIMSLFLSFDAKSLLLLATPTVLFSSYFVYDLSKNDIDETRKKFKLYGTLIGASYLLSNLIV